MRNFCIACLHRACLLNAKYEIIMNTQKLENVVYDTRNILYISMYQLVKKKIRVKKNGINKDVNKRFER